jgi:checkpoint serine/threonine-protein kinase
MIEGRPWTFQTDLFGLCGVIHCMLHGNYMETVLDGRTNELRPKVSMSALSLRRLMPTQDAIKRYWQGDLWKPLFRDLLNVHGCTNMPDLAKHRAAFENFLHTNSTKRKAVKTLLIKQNIMLFES